MKNIYFISFATDAGNTGAIQTKGNNPEEALKALGENVPEYTDVRAYQLADPTKDMEFDVLYTPEEMLAKGYTKSSDAEREAEEAKSKE